MSVIKKLFGGKKLSGNMIGDCLDKLHPIGSVYMSVESTNPSTLFGGGTWTQLTNRFMLAAGDSYSAGLTGGTSTHTLTIAQLPSHSHTFTGVSHSHTFTGSSASHKHYSMFKTSNSEPDGVNLGLRSGSLLYVNRIAITGASSSYNGVTSSRTLTPAGTVNGGSPTGSNSSTGGSGSHNNMPPYLVVYMWERTA